MTPEEERSEGCRVDMLEFEVRFGSFSVSCDLEQEEFFRLTGIKLETQQRSGMGRVLAVAVLRPERWQEQVQEVASQCLKVRASAKKPFRDSEESHSPKWFNMLLAVVLVFGRGGILCLI